MKPFLITLTRPGNDAGLGLAFVIYARDEDDASQLAYVTARLVKRDVLKVRPIEHPFVPTEI